MVYYIMHGLGNYQDFVAGDDMLLRALKRDVKEILNRMTRLYSPDGRPKTHGIGYIVK